MKTISLLNKISVQSQIETDILGLEKDIEKLEKLLVKCNSKIEEAERLDLYRTKTLWTIIQRNAMDSLLEKSKRRWPR